MNGLGSDSSLFNIHSELMAGKQKVRPWTEKPQSKHDELNFSGVYYASEGTSTTAINKKFDPEYNAQAAFPKYSPSSLIVCGSRKRYFFHLLLARGISEQPKLFEQILVQSHKTRKSSVSGVQRCF